jgi:hypothetical protein
MAAYGLYTHIQSNKRRSVALLIGLFFLVYVLVFAGALLAEVLSYGNAPLASGPWSDAATDSGKPFLPGEPPIGPAGGKGPWG